MKIKLLRLFGVVCLAIGLWLLSGLIPVFREVLEHAGTQKEIKGALAIPLVGLLLIAFGVTAIWKPEWLKDK